MGNPPVLQTATFVKENAFQTVENALDTLAELFEKETGNIGAKGLGALKMAWQRARVHAIEVNRERGGLAAGEYLADVADRLFQLVLRYAQKRANLHESTGLSLLAMGSYGRKDMSPYSDIDFVILHDDLEKQVGKLVLENVVSNLLRPLWDAGLQLGHAVRTPQQCFEVMEQEDDRRGLETATALMEARFVAGDLELCNSFLNRMLQDFFKRNGKFFIEQKIQEAQDRHKRPGAALYHTQPNLKESPGALRDYQLAIWIDRASQLSGHLPRLTERPLITPEVIDAARLGYVRILTLRTALHGAAQRKQEVLDYHMQEQLAERLGYLGADELRPVEVLIREYFQSATAIHRLADTVIRRYREERAIAERDIARLRRQRVDNDFIRISDYLYAAQQQLFAGPNWLEKAMRAFWHAARQDLSVSQEIRAAIQNRLPELTDEVRQDPAAAELFREIMSRRGRVTRVLRQMRDVGLLGAYLPEFGEVQGLVLHDVYHDYTVDEHTLFVIDNIDRLFFSSQDDYNHRLRRRIVERLRFPLVLRMAALIHDLGKSRGNAGHAQRGAEMVPIIAERLHMPEHETRMTMTLVREHLILSSASLRRDPSDPELIKELAGKIKSQELLDLLYLLTFTDASAVGQGTFTNWKDELLTALYRTLEAYFQSGGDAAAMQDAADIRQLLLESISNERRDEAQTHCELMPRRYLLEVSLEEAQMHLELLRKLRSEGREVAVAFREKGPMVDVWIAATDLPRRFAQICGAFLNAKVHVVAVHAYTRRDGLILDRIRVSSDGEQPLPELTQSAFWNAIATSIEEALSGRIDFRKRIAEARKRIPMTPQVVRAIEPRVRVDHNLSARYTVVDVRSGYRIGLLYGLSRALSDLGCDIHFVQMDTTPGLLTVIYYITEIGGGQLRDEERLWNICLLLKAVVAEFQAAKR